MEREHRDEVGIETVPGGVASHMQPPLDLQRDIGRRQASLSDERVLDSLQRAQVDRRGGVQLISDEPVRHREDEFVDVVLGGVAARLGPVPIAKKGRPDGSAVVGDAGDAVRPQTPGTCLEVSELTGHEP